MDFVAATCFAVIWLLSHAWFLLRLWRSRRRSRSRLEKPGLGSHQKLGRNDGAMVGGEKSRFLKMVNQESKRPKTGSFFFRMLI